MKMEEMNKQCIEKVIDRILQRKETDWNMDIEHFDWVPGVGLYGIFCAWESTKEPKYLNFLNGWIDRHLEEAYAQKTVNSTAPLLTVLSVYAVTKKEHLLAVCEDLAQYIIHDAPLTIDGGLEHTVTEPGPGFSDQMWADTLFMVCIFLTKLGSVTGKAEYTAFAQKQLLLHLKLLSDGNGLFYHGYNGAQKNHMSAIRWGRANGWIIYSTAKILQLSKNFDGRDKAEEALSRHAAALCRVQDLDGGYHTILDDPTSYIEISATAAIAAGMKLGNEIGVLKGEVRSAAERAIGAVVAAIAENGDVGSVSTGTPVMPDADAYKKIGMCPTLYGQGLAAVALS